MWINNEGKIQVKNKNLSIHQFTEINIVVDAICDYIVSAAVKRDESIYVE